MNRIDFRPASRLRAAFFAVLGVVCLFSCAGDDGGTSGTGIRTYQGKVLLSDDAPLVNGRLTVLEGGESATTDTNGQFSLQSQTLLPSVNLRVQASDLDVNVPIDNIPQETTEVNLDLQVDPATNTAETTRLDFSSVQSFALQATIVDGCVNSFHNVNSAQIVQLGPIKDGLSCTVRATVLGDGELQGGVLVGIERRSCDPGSPWRSVTTAYTPTGTHRGIVKIPFRYFNNHNACFYRIVAPSGDAKRMQTVGLETLSGVNQDRESGAQ